MEFRGLCFLIVAAALILISATPASSQPGVDTCPTAFNDICEDPTRGGAGFCPAGTDRADCSGRRRTARDPGAFFGRDDRVLFDTAEHPWSAIGQLQFAGGGACSGSLIAPDIVLTAAHCLIGQDGLAIEGRFITARGHPRGPFKAQMIEAHLIDSLLAEPDPDILLQENVDWALVRLDQPIGAEAGVLRVEVLRDNRPLRRDFISAVALVVITAIAAAAVTGRTRIVLLLLAGAGALALTVFAVRTTLGADPRREPLHQAGYSWDTGANLSGTSGCRLLEFRPSGLIGHDCDTVDGDSGSPLLVRRGGDWVIVGVISHSRRFWSGGEEMRDRAYAASAARLPDPDAVFTD